MRVQLLEGPPPKIWEGQKTTKFWRDFSRLWTLIANISKTERHIEHLKKKLDQPLPLPRWKKKIGWTLVHKQKSYSGSYWPTQVDIFSGDYISAITRCCRLKFLHALQTDSRYPAQPQRGRGSPKNFNRENLKFGLKFSVRTSITLVIVGISSPKFSRRRGELWPTNENVWAQILTHPKCSYTVSWRNSICHVVLEYGFRGHSAGGVVARGISNT